jgi:protein-S-isoprenylcysteine O-methyltransferase Ste14
MNTTEVVWLRLAMLAIGLLFMPIGAYHRFRAHTGEPLDRWQEGSLILFGLRLSGLVLFAAGFAWLINPAWLAWSSLPLPPWLRWTGVGLAQAAGMLWTWAVHHLGKNLTDTVVTRQNATLVTSGPYRWVRHPFYSALAMGLVAATLVTASALVGLLSFLAWFAFLVPRTHIEERNLITRFGEPYKAHMAGTGRYFPRFN